MCAHAIALFGYNDAENQDGLIHRYTVLDSAKLKEGDSIYFKKKESPQYWLSVMIIS
jgi:hypothetical protein